MIINPIQREMSPWDPDPVHHHLSGLLPTSVVKHLVSCLERQLTNLELRSTGVGSATWSGEDSFVPFYSLRHSIHCAILLTAVRLMYRADR